MLIAMNSRLAGLFLLHSSLFAMRGDTAPEGRMSDTAVATPSAPASSAPPSSSAPATSGAPSAAATPSRPKSFSDPSLSWSADAPASPASTPASENSTPTEQSAATTQPPADASSAVTPAPGAIPFDRHKHILDGAYKERDAFKSELTALKQQYDSPEGQRLRAWSQSFQQNPEQWFANTVAELAASNPNLVPNLRSQAARLLGQRQAPQPESFEPDIPVYNETGQMVAQTFSADKVKAIVQQAVNDALQKEVHPIKQDFQQRKQQEEVAAMERQANKTALDQFNAAKEWPGFLVDATKGTVDPDLAKAFNEHPDWSLERCYISTVVPKLRAKEQAQVLDDLKTKAAASSGINPAGAAVAATRRPKDFNDPSLRWS